jgi:hypothetical protein
MNHDFTASGVSATAVLWGKVTAGFASPAAGGDTAGYSVSAAGREINKPREPAGCYLKFCATAAGTYLLRRPPCTPQ